jgi:hypothetical protein
MSMRAYIVSREGEEQGYLGEGPGPFVSAEPYDSPHPWLETLRYTSLDGDSEAEVAAVLRAASDLEAAAKALRGSGFELSEVSYERVFMPARQVAPTHPDNAVAHRKSRARDAKDPS